MKISSIQKKSIPFIYASDVISGKIVTGKKIKKAVQRFYNWIEEADAKGFYLDHEAGMKAIDFFPIFLNHTKGKLQGKPFLLAPFQQFTIYNLFAWKDKSGNRRINTVYDKRAKKNGKTAEMAGLSLYCMSFDLEMEAEVYVGAAKEDQAKLCFNQAASFINSPVGNRALAKMGFYVMQKQILFKKTSSKMIPLGRDSTTQDGVNAHLSIIDEYHAHRDDGVKENLESSSIQRRQPITYHITTAGVNIASVCKNYEDSVNEILNGDKVDDSLWIMIHDIDDGDDWNDEKIWIKANPLLGQGLDISNIQKEYVKAKNSPSKVPNFKTKHLNMWVNAPKVWITTDVWQKNKVDKIPIEKFKKFGGYAALDLSSRIDITAYIELSEPDEKGKRYILPFFFCPEETIDRRSREDKVPYRYWRDAGLLISTPGNVVDYNIVEDFIVTSSTEKNIKRVELDSWNALNTATNLDKRGVNTSFFSQAITVISDPTKEFEKLVYEGKLLHDGNPILEWMLSGCQIVADANENIKVHKGNSNRTGVIRVDGIIACIMALGGSLTPEEKAKSKYSTDLDSKDIYI